MMNLPSALVSLSPTVLAPAVSQLFQVLTGLKLWDMIPDRQEWVILVSGTRELSLRTVAPHWAELYQAQPFQTQPGSIFTKDASF